MDAMTYSTRTEKLLDMIDIEQFGDGPIDMDDPDVKERIDEVMTLTVDALRSLKEEFGFEKLDPDSIETIDDMLEQLEIVFKYEKLVNALADL